MPAADLTDDPETLFLDTTDWSVVDDQAVPNIATTIAPPARVGRQRGRDPPVPDGQPRSLVAHHRLQPGRRHDQGAGALFDHEARQQDGHRGGDDHLGRTTAKEKTHPSTQCTGPGARGDAVGAPGCVGGGFVISRSLEYSARKAGVSS